ncbi:cmgc mapk mek kinase-related (incomplete catalytic triad) [Cystoisospora suis]|uniref:Cmgc mapk mek kinase-related (Incomplete catalytic triad) n=1 Tax=Cystoisospora suis TaxID=483139 RepID=A0A2C6K246_9APIC|nr:cmgc mapk mek kinase-related (incomplete catalytic triad) [Cystoisospora suis]
MTGLLPCATSMGNQLTFPVSGSISAHVDVSAILGSGAYGVVYGGYLSPSNQPIAVKIVKRSEQVLVLLNRLRKYQVEQFWTGQYKGWSASPRGSGSPQETDGEEVAVASNWGEKRPLPASAGKSGELATPSSRSLSRDLLAVLPPHPILPFPSPVSQEAALSRNRGVARQAKKGRREDGGSEHYPALYGRLMGLQTVEENEETSDGDSEESVSINDDKGGERGKSDEKGTNFNQLSDASSSTDQEGSELGVFRFIGESLLRRVREASGSAVSQDNSSNSKGQPVTPPSLFDSPHLLRVYGTYPCVDRQSVVIIMERLQGPSLFSYLMANFKRVLPSEELTCDFITPILKGLKEIHDKGYIHGDIKTENIMFRTVPPDPASLVIVDLDTLVPHKPEGDGHTYLPRRCRATQKPVAGPESPGPCEQQPPAEPVPDAMQRCAPQAGERGGSSDRRLEPDHLRDGAGPCQGKTETGVQREREEGSRGSCTTQQIENKKELVFELPPQTGRERQTDDGTEQTSSRGDDSVAEPCGRCVECLGFAVTPAFVPEGVVENRRISPFVDVFAAGCILYLFMEGCLPHERPSAGSKGIRSSGFISAPKKEPTFPRRQRPYSDVCENLMRRMLFPNHPERFESAGEALQHPWFDYIRTRKQQQAQEVQRQHHLRETEERREDDQKVTQKDINSVPAKDVEDGTVRDGKPKDIACKEGSLIQDEQSKNTTPLVCEGAIPRPGNEAHTGKESQMESEKLEREEVTSSPPGGVTGNHRSPPLSRGATTASLTDSEEPAGGGDPSSHEEGPVSPEFSRLPTSAVDGMAPHVPISVCDGSHEFGIEGATETDSAHRGIPGMAVNDGSFVSDLPAFGRILADLLSFIGQDSSPSAPVSPLTREERSAGTRPLPVKASLAKEVDVEDEETGRTCATFLDRDFKEGATTRSEDEAWKLHDFYRQERIMNQDAAEGEQGAEADQEGKGPLNSGDVGKTGTPCWSAELAYPLPPDLVSQGGSRVQPNMEDDKSSMQTVAIERRSRTLGESGGREGDDSSEIWLRKNKSEDSNEVPELKNGEGHKADVEALRGKACLAKQNSFTTTVIGWLVALLDTDERGSSRVDARQDHIPDGAGASKTKDGASTSSVAAALLEDNQEESLRVKDADVEINPAGVQREEGNEKRKGGDTCEDAVVEDSDRLRRYGRPEGGRGGAIASFLSFLADAFLVAGQPSSGAKSDDKLGKVADHATTEGREL